MNQSKLKCFEKRERKKGDHFNATEANRRSLSQLSGGSFYLRDCDMISWRVPLSELHFYALYSKKQKKVQRENIKEIPINIKKVELCNEL